jgi:oxygen-independent coproporphyrinogen-3 oxidase
MTARLGNRLSGRQWEYLPELAAEQLPRYTSYPPANRFTDSIDQRAATDALEALSADDTLSLYVHVPFCQKLCWYCGCHTSVPTVSDSLESYVDALVREIEIVGSRVARSAKVARLHFGGGSPEILTPQQIERIFRTLRASFSFVLFPDIAAEMDPRGLTQAVVQAFAAEGLTRASLGVQVLDAGVQSRINRIQPAAQIARAIGWLRDAGVASINADLMYGLPAQTIEHVVETATFTATHDIDRVAVFGYAHVPWMKKHQKSIDVAELPSGEERFRQAETAARTLEQAGYLAIGFDHFAAPGDPLAAASMQGRLRRNFQGYTDDNTTALIAFGASAISSLPDLIYQNTPSTAAYREAIGRGEMPVARGARLSAEDKRIGGLIERLLCDFEAVVPPDLLARSRDRLGALLAARVIELNGSRLTVTAKGQPYVRNVAACFDPEFAPQPRRHSLAI